jgi:hypothetical protein
MVNIATGWFIISTCQSPNVAALALDAIGRQLVQLFRHEKTQAGLTIFLLHLELHPRPLETWKRNALNNKKQEKVSNRF